MKLRGFSRGVVIAAVFAFFASTVVATLTPLFGFANILRLVIPMLGLVYLLYLMSRSQHRIGRITTLSTWTVLAITSWWATPPLMLYLLIHVAMIWLVRSLYFYSSILPALMDLGLSALGVSASVWALTRSGSVFLAIWTFFLVQALFVAIPPRVGEKTKPACNPTTESATFRQARQQADAALRQLFTH